jgi:hypothetical protein
MKRSVDISSPWVAVVGAFALLVAVLGVVVLDVRYQRLSRRTFSLRA